MTKVMAWVEGRPRQMQEGGTRPAVDFLKNGRKHAGKEEAVDDVIGHPGNMSCQFAVARAAKHLQPLQYRRRLLNRARALAAEHAS